MLDQVLNIFSITPDFDLNLMRQSQGLAPLTADVLSALSDVLSFARPELVLVHGDTTTTFAASLSAFYEKVPVGHVEAGLRTGNLDAPWPEELNRVLTSRIAKYHFAPTEGAMRNLLSEGIRHDRICVTGNTVVDALLSVRKRILADDSLQQRLQNEFQFLDESKRLVLVTGHRRENFGPPLRNICTALREIVARHPDAEVCYPVHLNPNVIGPVNAALGNTPKIHLIPPLDYVPFVYLMMRAHLIVTDSGGIQEEAASIGKPTLVMRDTTERPEAIESGSVCLVGTTVDLIVKKAYELLADDAAYASMASARSPFGDGTASDRIAQFLFGDAVSERIA
jgi:UDP-N-acetylglucosamine 2-epimerase (non-hydrolysing)